MVDWLGSVFCVMEGVLVLTLLSLELPLAPAAALVASDWFPVVSEVRMCAGIRMPFSSFWMLNSCSVKLKSGGSSRVLGNRVSGSRNSSKKECAQAWRGVIRNDGVYSRSRATNSIASGGVRALKTWKQREKYFQKLENKLSLEGISFQPHGTWPPSLCDLAGNFLAALH